MINDKARKNKVLVSLKWVGDAMGQSPGTMLNHQDRAANGKNVIVLTKYSIYIYIHMIMGQAEKWVIPNMALNGWDWNCSHPQIW